MPNAFRAITGEVWRAGQHVSLTLADGTPVAEKWAGSATEERLHWWLRAETGNLLATTAPVAAVGTNRNDRFALLGTLDASGRIQKLAPPEPPAPSPPAQGELF